MKDTEYSGEGTKYVGKGTSVIKGPCCPCMNNKGDSFVFDGTNGTADNPMFLVPGDNLTAPPCMKGKEMMEVRFVDAAPAAAGAPDTASIER